MNFIQETCNQIVIPPKLKYATMDLGYAITNQSRRQDFQIRNNDNEILKCSLYIPKQLHPSHICVIYLHSMNGSRLQCLTYVDRIVKMGLFMASFDFSGCGNSDGTSISFGANQKYDVNSVIQEIAGKFGIRRFVLWGRSMGAVASIKYCQMTMTNSSFIQIRGIILDSPFQSLKQLIIQLGVKRTDMPSFFVHAFYLLIKSTLEKKGKFSVDDLELVKSIKTIQGIPICFMVSKDDTTIDPSHSEALYNAYKSWDKKLVYFNGLHNESRDEDYLQHVIRFIEDKINRPNIVKKAPYYKRQEKMWLNHIKVEDNVNVIYFGNEMIYSVYIFHFCYDTHQFISFYKLDQLIHESSILIYKKTKIQEQYNKRRKQKKIRKITNMNNNSNRNYEFIEKYLLDKLKKHLNIIATTVDQLEKCTHDEQSQSIQLMTLKCKSLSAGPSHELTQAVIMLVSVAYQLKCQYDYKFAEEILKEMFMRDAAGKLENEEIIRIFKQFGFDTNNFEVLTYQDPWYIRLNRWLFD